MAEKEREPAWYWKEVLHGELWKNCLNRSYMQNGQEHFLSATWSPVSLDKAPSIHSLVTNVGVIDTVKPILREVSHDITAERAHELNQPKKDHEQTQSHTSDKESSKRSQRSNKPSRLKLKSVVVPMIEEAQKYSWAMLQKKAAGGILPRQLTRVKVPEKRTLARSAWRIAKFGNFSWERPTPLVYCENHQCRHTVWGKTANRKGEEEKACLLEAFKYGLNQHRSSIRHTFSDSF